MSALVEAFAAAEAIGIEQHRIRVGDLHFNVSRFGRGRPLLLLHGWPEFWLVWRPVMERLGGEFELIAPDLRGCGDTGKPFPGPDATATADRHAVDMFGLMDALDIKRFGVVGGDLGAYVAQAMSHLAPERLEGSFYFCTPYPGLGFRYGQPGHLIEVWYQYLQQLPWVAELIGSSRDACRILDGRPRRARAVEIARPQPGSEHGSQLPHRLSRQLDRHRGAAREHLAAHVGRSAKPALSRRRHAAIRQGLGV
jgi:pimeloyl-ACP methyl ester carboxylesterase